MITAALITFAVLGLAWLFAPGDQVGVHEPMNEGTAEALPEAA